MKTPMLFKRFSILAILFNLPPVITPIFIVFGFEPILLIATLGIWANLPLLLGLSFVVDSSSIVLGEFGMMKANTLVMLAIVGYWLVIAALLTCISTVFSRVKF